MPDTVVVYVHGLWVNGWEATLLRRRLEQHLGCRALSFGYSSVRVGFRENARSLAALLQGMPADTVHLVGHSMGGLLVLEIFEAAPWFPPGRIVLLGSPARGSRAARNLARWPLGRRIMGPAACEELLQDRDRRWNGARDLGVIAGTLAVGLGRITGPLDGPNDGTVLASETRIEGARDRLILRTTHSGMLYSPIVARQVSIFLREGRFAAESAV
jgi:pimeloyl-ACP methyl ester carboxylesterase